MKHILIFAALLYTATGFSQNQCVDLFSQPSKLNQKTQITESDILKHLDALVAEKLRIDYDRFENENQKKQAVETFKTSLFNILKIDQKYLTLFKQKYSEKTVQYKTTIKNTNDKNLKTENDRQQILEKSIFFDPHEIYERKSKEWMESANLSVDGKYFVISDRARPAQIIEVSTGKLIWEIQPDTKFHSAKLSPNNELLATLESNERGGIANIYKVLTGEILFQIKHDDYIKTVEFSSNGKFVLTQSRDHTAKVYDVSLGKEILHIIPNLADLKSIASAKFSPDDRYIITSETGVTKVYEVFSGHEVMHIPSENRLVSSSEFSPDSKYIATISSNGMSMESSIIPVIIYDVISKKEVFRIEHTKRHVHYIHFSPNSRYIMTASADGAVKIYSIDTGKEVFKFQSDRPIYSAKFSSDGRFYMIAGPLSTDIYDFQTQQIIYKYTFKDARYQSFFVGFSADNEYAITSSRSTAVVIKLNRSNFFDVIESIK